MHIVFRESHGLEDTDNPVDIGQDPADMVALSFADSDLSAFAAGWRRAEGTLPTLRLANLANLKHPLSVDTYIENTLSGARAILIRLIGGEAYWPYGLSEVRQLAKREGIALAVLPADGRADQRLDAISTLPGETLAKLRTLCDMGGTVASQAALAELSRAAGFATAEIAGTTTVPEFGYYDPDLGVLQSCPSFAVPPVLVTFYRSYVAAADLSPIDTMIEKFRAIGIEAMGMFAPSLKDEDVRDWMEREFGEIKPKAIVNATAFSARAGDGGTSPLDGPGCPVFQVALSSAPKDDWLPAERGLSPQDLAMHVTLPEVDGRIFSGVASFKSAGERDRDLQHGCTYHRADSERVEAITAKVANWLRLKETPPEQQSIAIILSTYPGKSHQMAHAVGLDTFASLREIGEYLATLRYQIGDLDGIERRIGSSSVNWPVADFEAACDRLPAKLKQDLKAAWGAIEDDPAVNDGHFAFQVVLEKNLIVALQPERGTTSTRVDDYHDLSRTPSYAYVAFYLWLQSQEPGAIVHMGAHGTLEWLPGKAVALSGKCWPEVLAGNLPVIYPFIVNDPGEAAQAKRRISAVTIGHMPPELIEGAVPRELLSLESLLDEYSTADGLDPARRGRLIGSIREAAQLAGVEEDLGIAPDASPFEAITAIDRFVCDIKESQFGDGLHVFGSGPQGAAELRGLGRAIRGLRVDPGPSGSPHRGRNDVLPTGRNLYTTDPRSVPTASSYTQGVKLAEELVRRHLQDHGDYPKNYMIDLWGSATMRTAGEEFAMALHLAGVAPKWDEGSQRVSGFEILPLVLLDRPRIDVTLRVSGFFRDVFPGLAQLFEAAAEQLKARVDSGMEDQSNNPYGTAIPRVYCPRPGKYGIAMDEHLDVYTDEARRAAGDAWLKASEWTIDKHGELASNPEALNRRVIASDGFAHVQDLPETDLLLATDYASHEAGFAAAVAALGGQAPKSYHIDHSKPGAATARSLNEEIARIVYARATNPAWLSGMMRHGFRGGAEIAATLDHMAAFAHLAGVVSGRLFDAYYEATVGDETVTSFLRQENPDALAAMEDRFRALAEAGLWRMRRNWVTNEVLGGSS